MAEWPTCEACLYCFGSMECRRHAPMPSGDRRQWLANARLAEEYGPASRLPLSPEVDMFPEVDSEMYCGEWRGSRGETFVGAVVKALEEEES